MLEAAAGITRLSLNFSPQISDDGVDGGMSQRVSTLAAAAAAGYT